MAPSSSRTFSRGPACPDHDALLAYHSGDLGALAREQVRAHVGRCDFCGAASQLLSKHRPAEVTAEAAPLPLHLRLLAETLLAAQRSERRQAA